MMQALLISNIALWCVVVAMGLVIVALVRQVGVLYERVAPAGALAVREGAEVGQAAPQLSVETLAGKQIEIGAPREDGRASLIFFLSPICPVCKTLLPALLSLGRHEAKTIEVLLASDGERAEHEEFVEEYGLSALPYILSPDLGISFGVSKLPFAALVDHEGVLRARGLVNTREHLESLLEAMELGVGSIQEYLERESLIELRSPGSTGP
ncbi:MAG: methylamine dehydrogenase accessory protein MauD [Deltaproteobacteria bacterium]|nr:methylamine dehydrogenase accessory protein MauD [Deltaproteobacteria bacterium]MBW2724379.1 methylamine dehydrogenase accessory protein MauD [Deltaproteobacteria bacterium]